MRKIPQQSHYLKNSIWFGDDGSLRVVCVQIVFSAQKNFLGELQPVVRRKLHAPKHAKLPYTQPLRMHDLLTDGELKKDT